MSCSRTTDPMLRAALAVLLCTGAAHAQEFQLGLPSAVQDDAEPVTVAPSEGYGSVGSGFGSDIDSVSLEAPSVEAAGLAGAGTLGLGQGMWGTTPGPRAIALIDGVTPTALHSVNRLVRRVLVAGATPPEDSDGLLAARARALTRFGAAEEAASLAGAAGSDPGLPLRRARAEAALIVGRDETLCETQVLGGSQPVAQESDRFWPALRAYCLARTGDPLAAVAVNAMVELGSVDPTDAPLLEALIDESLIDYVPVPHASSLTPLRVAMLRSMGRANRPAIDSAPLPAVAGLFALESTGARGALVAAERLEAVGAIDTKILRELYDSYADDVDGPLGARAKAVRAARTEPDARAIGDALLAAARTSGPGGFAQLARVLAPAAAKVAPRAAADLGAAGYALRDAMLLGGFAAEAGAWSDAQGTKTPAEQADIAAVMAVADPARAGGWTREHGDALRLRTRGGDEHARRALASLAGLGIALRPSIPEEGFVKDAREGRTAEAVLRAAKAIGREDPPTARTLDRLIRALRDIGLEKEARAIAIEAMIAERWR